MVMSSMRYFYLFFLLFLTGSQLLAQTRSRQLVGEKFGFVENKGQIKNQLGEPNADVLYLLNHEGLNVQVKTDGFSYDTYQYESVSGRILDKTAKSTPYANGRVNFHRVDITFPGSNPFVEIVPQGLRNDIIYTTESQGTPLRHYSVINYRNLYPGIDLRLHINAAGALEYDFVVNPGGDPELIQMAFEGQNKLTKSGRTTLDIELTHGVLQENIPLSYLQQSKSEVDVSYRQVSSKTIAFQVGSYDTKQTLVIDPTPNLLWATYYGGSLEDSGESVTSDGSGNIYVAGYTFSTANIATSGAHQTSISTSYDGFFAKFNSSGVRQFATYYGGGGDEIIFGIAVDASGNIFISGLTSSTTGIATSGSQQNTAGGDRDAFLAKFNSLGARQWGTYYGGTLYDAAFDLTLDNSGNPVIAGRMESTLAMNGHQTTIGGAADGFYASFNSSTGVRVLSSYVGGTLSDGATKIIADAGNIYVVGWTQSTTGISTAGTYQTSLGGAYDGFVTKYANAGTKTWGTYYGGLSDDEAYAIGLDASSNVYIGGYTQSTTSIASVGAYSTSFTAGGTNGTDGFVAKLNASGARVWGSYFGGDGDDILWAISENSGNIYAIGETTSTSSISTSGVLQTTIGGGYDAVLANFNSSGGLTSATYYGGSADEFGKYNTVDPSGNVIFSGLTASTTGIASGGHQTTYGGGAFDAFLVKVDAGTSTLASEPTAQPTNLTIVDLQPTQFTYDITAAAGVTGGYLHIYKAGSAPTSLPVDGVEYSSGDVLPDGSIVKYSDNIAAGNFYDGLTAGTSYFVKVFSFNGSGSSTNYLTTNPLSATITTTGGSLDTEPGAQPTSFIASSITSNSFTISFTAASGAPAGYIAVRATGSAPNTDPVDGTAYTVGGTLGNGTIAFVNTGATFNETGLAPSTNYFYKIYSFNGSGSTINYRQTTPLQGNQTTNSAILATEPAAQPITFISSSVTSSSATVTFANAGSAGPGYIAIRKIGSAPTTDPVDGNSYTAGASLGDGVVAYAGVNLTFNEAGLTAGTSYFYKIYSVNGSASTSNYLVASPLQGNFSTSASGTPEPTAQPTNFAFSSATGTGYTASFTAASSAPAGYIAVRRTGSSGPTTDPVDGTAYTAGATLGDGTIAFVGTATSFNETALTSSTQYIYKIYAFNGSGATINYLQNNPLIGSANTTGGTLAAEPAGSPTSLTFTSVGSTSFTGNYVAPSPAPASYIVIGIASVAVPVAVPVDGVAYVAGQPLGSATITYVGPLTSISITGSAATTYSFAVYAFNGSGSTTNYRLASPATGSVTTLAIEPTAQPTAFSFSSVTSSSATVNFTTSAAAGYLAIRRAGSAPTGNPSDALGYTIGQAIGDGTVAYSGTNGSFNDSGLSPSTQYHYKIFAFNGSGATANYFVTGPLTGNLTTSTSGTAEPTAQPTNLIFSNETATSFDVSFTAASGAPAGYIGIASTTVPDVPVDGITYTTGESLTNGFVSFIGSATFYNVTGADPSTTLNYAVYSYNGTGSTINYRQTSPLTGSVTTDDIVDPTEPVLAGNTTPTKVASGQTLKISATWQDAESGVYYVEVDYGPTNSQDWTAIDVEMTNTTGNIWEFTILASAIKEQGVEYRMTAYNNAGLSKDSEIFRTVLEHAGTGLVIPYSSFGEAQSNYRIISIPLVLEKKTLNDIFGAKLGNYDPKKWRVFRYQGGYRELTGTSTLDLGNGYMFIAKENKGVLNTGAGVTGDFGFSKPFTFNPANGWNLIGNPFNFTVNWADVQGENASLSSVQLKTYAGGSSMVSSTTLPSFSGGFIFLNSTTAITIPHVKPGRVAEKLPDVKHALDADQWLVELIVNAGDLSSVGGIGMSTGASLEYDQQDDFTLPRLVDYVELNHDKKLHGSYYTKDVVPLSADFEWSFRVESNNTSADVITINWDNSYFGSNEKELILWDETEQLPIDMKNQNLYSFKKRNENRFKVFFGSKQFTKEKTRPNSIVFHSVFPVPASSQVTFAFSTPDNSGMTNTSLDVYNQLGQRIASLINGVLETGYHEVSWSIDQGQKPLSGIYIAILRQGKEFSQQKLIIK
jgi:Beta-propeller repeat